MTPDHWDWLWLSVFLLIDFAVGVTVGMVWL